MNRHLGVLACCVTLALGCSDDGSDPDPSPSPDGLAQEMQERFDEAAAEGFSGSALVTVGGEHVLSRGYGLADRDGAIANDENTAFDVGSILKTLTATAIYQLAEDDALALSDPLSAFFPDAPADKADVTLLQLLQHRAGFDEYHDTTGDFEAMTRTEARERIFAQELLFPPGSDEAYSNSGYTLLADVIETASGESYVDYIRRAVFAAAGMGHSGFYPDSLWDTVDTAIGYDASTFGSNDPATWPYTWALVGNGGLVSTPLDLERFLRALWEGRLLGAATLERMLDDYLAQGAADVAGETLHAAAGAGDYGLGGVLLDVPELDTRVIITTNTYEVFDIEELAVDLMSTLLEAQATPQR